MNLPPPPDRIDDFSQIEDYFRELYRFLESPAFQSLLMIPRSSAPDTIEGTKYYDSDDNTERTYDGTAWEHCMNATNWEDLL